MTELPIRYDVTVTVARESGYGLTAEDIHESLLYAAEAVRERAWLSVFPPFRFPADTLAGRLNAYRTSVV